MEENKERTGAGISRRTVIPGMLPLIAAASIPKTWAAETPATQANRDKGTFPGLITREREPINLEFPFPTLDGVITPNHLFYVRNHFPVPQLDAAAWRLAIDGEVRQQLSLGYDELRKLPAKTVMATLECAGNSRVLLVPKAKGVQWEQGAVSNAEWTGVPLSVLLDRAGINDSAIEVILEGADKGEIIEEPKTPGTISFARSLPIAKVRRGEVLIAYQMNGKDLAPEHGFPVRAIVLGWYGMASVKWLTRITATATPYEGYWQTLEYAYWQRTKGLPTLVPITEMQVKAEIARPTLHEIVAAGAPYRVFGAAWSGESDVTRVEVSSDSGATWNEAELLGKATLFAWRLWEYNWSVPQKRGRHKLMARATDRQGKTQPVGHDPDRRNYLINFTAPVEVDVQ